MRIHRFYISTPITEKIFDITDRELVHQWRSVFRYNVGSQVILFDGSGFDHYAMITSLRNIGATASIFQKIQNNPTNKYNVWLCMALIKKDNFELVAQKVTELGISHILPILSERTEKKNINLDRLHKIVIEASEQSGRGDVPVIHEITTLSKILEQPILPEMKIALHLQGTRFNDLIRENKKKSAIALFIGPEGGWNEDEIEIFKKHTVNIAFLETNTLRAETAAIASTSVLLLT